MKRRFECSKIKERFAEIHAITLLEYKIADNVIYLKPEGFHASARDNNQIGVSVKSLDYLIIHPGEVFSFQKTFDKPLRHLGFRESKLSPQAKIGLRTLIDSLHLLIIQSPLDVLDVRLPSGGASPIISYSDLDYRFKNNTHQCFQLHGFRIGDFIHVELRSEQEIPFTYHLVEEDRGFRKEGEKYYQVSKIFREKVDVSTGELLEKTPVFNNHSEVKFDCKLIPEELILE